jgi:hypothetical protein
VGGTLKCADMPKGTVLTIYTVSGEPVFTGEEKAYRVEWNGHTKKGERVAPGIFYFLVRQGTVTLLKGTLIIQ